MGVVVGADMAWLLAGGLFRLGIECRGQGSCCAGFWVLLSAEWRSEAACWNPGVP